MTSCAGLTMIDQYERHYRIHSRLKQTVKRCGFKGDYGTDAILFFVLILIGTERLQHIEYLKTDRENISPIQAFNF